MDYRRPLTYSLINAAWGAGVGRILSAALEAVDPYAAVLSRLKVDGESLIAGGQVYDLESVGDVYVVGAGKAGERMSRAINSLLGGRLRTGLVVVKDGHEGPPELQSQSNIEILTARHPVPDKRSVSAAQRIRAMLKDTRPEDLVICLISGGGSALLTDPAPGVSLREMQSLTEALLASGANINEINILRKHLDQVKGGNIARLAAPARMLTLILSDVVGSPLDVIASGPTVPDPSTYADAIEILQRYDLEHVIPPSISRHLEQGRQGSYPETPKPGEPFFNHIQNIVIGSNQQAAEAAIIQAQSEGYYTLLLTTFLQGEARQAGRVLAAIARQINTSGQPIPRPACVITGGETTVTLRGDGLGGRNQELALGAVEEMDGIPAAALVSLASDGGDGPTDAAGAVVTGETLSRARALDMRPADFLARNDAYHFFEPLGDLLRTGPTRTNVNDLTFLFLN